MSIARVLVLVGLLAVLGLSLLWSRQSSSGGPDDPPQLTYVATAHQLGIVGYRDPVGAIDPTAGRIAYSEGRRLRVVPIGGGMSLRTPDADGQIRHLAWVGTTGDVIIEDTGADRRWWIVTPGAARKRPLWDGRTTIEGTPAGGGEAASVGVNALRQLAVSPDGQSVAAVASGREGPEVWRIAIDGSRAETQRVNGQPSAPAWISATDVACVITRDGRARLTVPCGGDALVLSPDVDVIGPVAFAPTGSMVYFASPGRVLGGSKDPPLRKPEDPPLRKEGGDAGMVDLWKADLPSRGAHRVTSFGRDTYAPSMASDETTIVKTQSYRTHVAEIELASGATTQLTSFQAETPSYDPEGKRIAVTYGTWRRVMDDAKYPDIAQELGLIDSGPRDTPFDQPLAVIADSDSEDQAMAWSPNGRWIAFHSHREQSDDIWLRPADGSAPDRRITFLGRGAETGWPRWSPDGATVLLDGASPQSGRSALFTIGVDQTSGQTASELREIAISGFNGELTHAEWLPDSRTVVAIGKEGPGRHAIVEAPVTGGAARIVHRFETEHDFSGLAVSPDGRQVAFVAPADDGYFQIFRMPLTGGPAVRVTTDPSHKSQPAWSPDGRRIAFTVWSYDALFWRLR